MFVTWWKGDWMDWTWTQAGKSAVTAAVLIVNDPLVLSGCYQNSSTIDATTCCNRSLYCELTGRTARAVGRPDRRETESQTIAYPLNMQTDSSTDKGGSMVGGGGNLAPCYLIYPIFLRKNTVSLDLDPVTVHSPLSRQPTGPDPVLTNGMLVL